ncbi:MAG TPA: mannose-1-phosphate guanylyltransferase/mannose-6-phosphate isomerase [Rhodospirillaceae bacterium]|nr:mannose-1-phosphate guanylyltransferase/mannose-6-phosphate isomerase [Rhodospirillaceae bacterium]
MSKPASLYPVILSGGSGSRLWPLSREELPKQLQPLISAHSLLQDAVLRLGTMLPSTRYTVQPPIIICNEEHRFIVAEQLRAVNVKPKAIVIEPVGRNTAPAACVAALLLEQEPDALLFIMPSDHLVRRPKALHAAIATAIPVATAGHVVTFGIEPTAPSSAYGYIKRGVTLPKAPDLFTVDGFVEKPNAVTAAKLVKTGGHYWNGGMFMCPVALYLSELEQNEPAISSGCRSALEKGENDLFFFRLDAENFSKVPAQSIDYGIMEHTDKAVVVPVDMGWSDVGSWSALHAESKKDASGNTLIGDVLAVDTADTYVRSDKQLTTVIGVKSVIVVVTADAVLVADKTQDQNVKKLVEKLKAEGRSEATVQVRTYRPWGWFETVDEEPRFKVKRICVKPGAQLSLQKHQHRSEHWVVVTGTARVTKSNKSFVLKENESTFIPSGTIHRLSNPGQIDLQMIEVQSGDYVGEDDIVRITDDYGRVVADDSKKLSKNKTTVGAKPKTKKDSPLGSRRKADPQIASQRRAQRSVMRPTTKTVSKKVPQKKPPSKGG